MKNEIIIFLCIILFGQTFAQSPEIPISVQNYLKNTAKIVTCTDDFNDVKIGWTYQEENEIPFPNNRDCPFKSCLVKPDSNLSQNISLSSEFIKSESEYFRAKEINISAAAKYKFVGGGIGGSISANKEIEYTQSSTNIYWVMDFKKVSRVEYLSDYSLNANASTLFNSNKVRFIEAYGDFYVATIIYGQRIKFIFSYEASSETDASNIKETISALIKTTNLNISVSSEQREKIKSVLSSKRLRISMISQGIKNDFDVMKLLTFSDVPVKEQFNLAVQKSIKDEVPILLGIRAFPGITQFSQFNENTLRKALYWNDKLGKQIAKLEELINSDKATSEDKEKYKLFEQKQNKEVQLDSLSSLAKAYLQNPSINNRQILWNFTLAHERAFYKFEIPPPPPTILAASANGTMSNNNMKSISLRLKENTKYTISYTFKYWPVENGSGYFEGSSTLRIEGYIGDKALGSHMTREGKAALHSGDIEIETKENPSVQVKVLLENTKWSDSNHQIRDQNFNIQFEVVAKEQL